MQMAYNDLDDANDRQMYRNYGHRISQRTEETATIEAKLVVMGNTGVGKTSLVTRYTENRFSQSTTATTGALFVTHKTDFAGHHVKLQIWDTAGQERFRSLAPIYYRGANAAIIMYDLTRLESFNDVRIWIEELKKNCDPDLMIYIVGSKADLTSQRQVSADRVRSTLHKWFPPARRAEADIIRPHTPTSFTSGINAYLRPRFTSLTSAYTVNSGSSNGSGMKVNLTRSNTTAGLQSVSPRKDGARFNSFQSFDALPTVTGPQRVPNKAAHHRERSWGPSNSTSPLMFPSFTNNGSKDFPTEAVTDDDEEEEEWGLGKFMHLFEVSAKDSSGIDSLFETVLGAVIQKRDAIEAERRERVRDSILLHVHAPLPEEDEARDKDTPQRSAWSCC